MWLCTAGNEEIADFLLQNGAGFSSYTLMDHPAFSKHVLRGKLLSDTDADGQQVCTNCVFVFVCTCVGAYMHVGGGVGRSSDDT